MADESSPTGLNPFSPDHPCGRTGKGKDTCVAAIVVAVAKQHRGRAGDFFITLELAADCRKGPGLGSKTV